MQAILFNELIFLSTCIYVKIIYDKLKPETKEELRAVTKKNWK